MGKVLIVFDFDDTLVDCNTDIEVRKLGPNGDIPPEIKKEACKMNWTEFMQIVFNYLHEQKVSPQAMKDFIRTLPLTPGVEKLLPNLKSDDRVEIIIISDANSFFITEILNANDLTKYITALFTHEAGFEDDRLVITRLNPEVECEKGAGKMCKGHILKGYLRKREAEGVKFDVVKYVGDGMNDFCPMTELPKDPDGVAFIRQDFPLDKYLKVAESARNQIIAKIIIWSDISVVANN